MKFATATDASRLSESKSSVLIGEPGGRHRVPELILEALKARFPRDRTLTHVEGIGDRSRKGAGHFRHEGMPRPSIASAVLAASAS